MGSEATSRPVRSRRAAREAALKAAYQIRIGRWRTEDALTDILAQENFAPEAAEFVAALIRGIDRNVERIDGLIRPVLAEGWDFERLAETDRAILRLAVFELYGMPEIPPKATINEAVDLAKRYGTEDSGRFVNGVLGRLLSESPKANWVPPAEPDWDEPEPLAPVVDEVEEVVQEGSEEHQALRSAGPWRLRREVRS